jgi:hypothetical protein
MSAGKSDDKAKEEATPSADELALAVMEDTRRRAEAVAGARTAGVSCQLSSKEITEKHCVKQSTACSRTWSAPGRVLDPMRCSWQALYWVRLKVCWAAPAYLKTAGGH